MTEHDEPDLLAGLRDGAWLDAQQFAPLSYAVPGVIPEGSSLLAGPPKIGKSWFVLSCALAVAAGGRALSHVAVDKRPVLYLALEDGHRRLQDRCRTLLGSDPIPPGFQYLTTIRPGSVVATIGAWLGRQHDAAPLVILDTLGRTMPHALPGESAYQRDYRIGATLKRLADDSPGTALLVNHHDRKANSEDFVDTISGTHGLAGAADTIITLTRARHETTGLLRVTGRDVAEGEYALVFDQGAIWRLNGTDLGEAAREAERSRIHAGVGDRMADILDFVAQCPNGVTPLDVAEATGIDNDQAGRYLRRAATHGRVVRIERGVYAPTPPYRSVRVSETDTPHTSTYRSGWSNSSIGQLDASDTHTEEQP